MQLHEFRSLISGLWILILPHFWRKWYFYIALDCKICTLIYFKARIRHTLRSLSIRNIFAVMRKKQYCIVCIFINYNSFYKWTHNEGTGSTKHMTNPRDVGRHVSLTWIQDCMCLMLDREWSFASGQDVDQSLSSFLHFW